MPPKYIKNQKIQLREGVHSKIRYCPGCSFIGIYTISGKFSEVMQCCDSGFVRGIIPYLQEDTIKEIMEFRGSTKMEFKKYDGGIAHVLIIKGKSFTLKEQPADPDTFTFSDGVSVREGETKTRKAAKLAEKAAEAWTNAQEAAYRVVDAQRALRDAKKFANEALEAAKSARKEADEAAKALQ